jgi:hypothetical protein
MLDAKLAETQLLDDVVEIPAKAGRSDTETTLGAREVVARLLSVDRRPRLDAIADGLNGRPLFLFV